MSRPLKLQLDFLSFDLGLWLLKSVTYLEGMWGDYLALGTIWEEPGGAVITAFRSDVVDGMELEAI